jgi:hypothetical protein
VDRLAKRDRDQTGFQTVTSNRNASDLFACKWLRARATTEVDPRGGPNPPAGIRYIV